MILFSTPNSGSDWFASMLIAGDPKKRYFREFFNPITNDKYIDDLAGGFGCEFITTYKNIARLDKRICEEIYQKTWQKEQFNFTKENYSVFKIPFFVEKFDCIGLTRKIEHSFPPRRRDHVFWWYDCIYNSMVANFDTLPPKTKKMLKISENTLSSIEHKILMCNHIYQETLKEYCNDYKIPIIEWESLVDKKEVIKELTKLPYDLNLEAMVEFALETKEYEPRNFKIYGFNPQTHIEESK